MTGGTAHYNDSGTMTDRLLQIDLHREIEEAAQKRPWQSGVFSKTVLKKEDLRAVLIALDSGSKIREHHADGTISIQVLQGRIRFRTEGQAYEMAAGSLLSLAPSIKHDVEALEDAAFLLTIAWPRSKELEAMPHRGYGS